MEREHLIALAQAHLIADPAEYPVMQELFTSRGAEIYSALTAPTPSGERVTLDDDTQFGSLLKWAYDDFGCILLGLCLSSEADDSQQGGRDRLWLRSTEPLPTSTGITRCVGIAAGGTSSGLTTSIVE